MKKVTSRWMILFFCYSIILLLASCSKTVYVPVESVRTEYTTAYSHDSIYVSDSVIIRTKADTVWYEKYKIRYRDRLLRDSIIVIDSVQMPYPVEVVKEVNQLKDWQLGLMIIGAVAVGFLLFRIITFFKAM